MRDRLYEFGPFSIAFGHDVGMGPPRLAGDVLLVTRWFGIGIGPLGFGFIQNVTREALREMPRERRPSWQDDDPFDDEPKPSMPGHSLPVRDEALPIPTVTFDANGAPAFVGSIEEALRPNARQAALDNTLAEQFEALQDAQVKSWEPHEGHESCPICGPIVEGDR